MQPGASNTTICKAPAGTAEAGSAGRIGSGAACAGRDSMWDRGATSAAASNCSRERLVNSDGISNLDELRRGTDPLNRDVLPGANSNALFLPLVTGRANGTGLGLAVAQEIATRHGGIVEFESAPGRTVFTMLLPIVEPA